MLTKVKEGEKIKCAHYWPKSEEEEKVYTIEGNLVVGGSWDDGGGGGGGDGGSGGGGGGGSGGVGCGLLTDKMSVM